MRREQGSAMIESAIALPIILFLVIAAIFLGLYVNAQVTANSAARAGAREYGVFGDYDRAVNSAEVILSAGGLSGDREVVIEDRGDAVEVTVHYYQAFPASAFLGGTGSIGVTGYAVYRREEP